MPFTYVAKNGEVTHTSLVPEGVRVFNQGNNPLEVLYHQYRQLVRHMGNIL
jgi:hypothetical protein